MQLTGQLYVQCIIANESTKIAISACDCGSIKILRSRYGEDRGVACSTDVDPKRGPYMILVLH